MHRKVGLQPGSEQRPAGAGCWGPGAMITRADAKPSRDGSHHPCLAPRNGAFPALFPCRQLHARSEARSIILSAAL